MEGYIGTSGWAYKTWQPDFFPPKLPQKQFLRYYATKLNAVEVNYTFRHALSEKTIEKWLAETPESFRFVLKARRFCHLRQRIDLGRCFSSFPGSSRQTRRDSMRFWRCCHEA